MELRLMVEGAGRALAPSGEAGVVALYQTEAGSLLGLMWMHTGDRAAAEDIVQEAFVRATRLSSSRA